MKRLVIFCIIVVIFAGCGGSSSIDKAISQVEKALENVEKNKGKMTENDWHNLEKEVEQPLLIIHNALESNKIGAIQKIKLITVTAKWAAVLMEAGLSEIEKITGTAIENWETELEKMAKELENFSQEFEKAANELENAVQGLESN